MGSWLAASGDHREDLLEASATTTTLRLAESLLDRPFVIGSKVARRFDVTKPTAQKAIDALVDRGILEEITGQKRNRIYRSPRIMAAVYGTGDHGGSGPEDA
jgi:Fic family protein